jgi:carotenoid 1,2-hydratase
VDAAGRLHPAPTPPDGAQIDPLRRWPLPRTRWGLSRATWCAGQPSLVDTLEDGPFYSRSLWSPPGAVNESPGHWAMHESLSLDRFANPWVQAMLPFRMPRRGG